MKLLGWFDGYLAKPVKKQRLFEVLDRALTNSGELETVEELEPADEEGPAESAVIENPRRQSLSEGDRQKGRVLVAEDHEVNQRLFKTILENIGFLVDVAANGKLAVEAAEKTNYDIIFMDVQMPEMNGYEATERIRATGVETPIVAVTASAIKSELDRCRTVGMSDVLTKPFKKRDLLPVLDKWLGAKVAGSGSTQQSTSSDGEEPDERAVFDYQEAVNTFLGNRPVVEKVFFAYVEKISAQLPELRSAAESRDLEIVRQIGHSIKGGGWNLGVKRVGDIGEEIETAGREGAAERVPELIVRLEEGVEELRRVGKRVFPTVPLGGNA